MAYSYPIVSLDTDNEVYADIEMADAYLNAAIHGQTWFALDDTIKGQALVSATRTLERQQWKGDPADPVTPQALDWPRINTGVIGVVADEVPIDIINASIELALSLSQGSSVQTETAVSQKISSLKAGSVSISYFGGAEVTTTQRFPTIIDELIAPYLLGGGSSLGANNFGTTQGVGAGLAYGTDGVSETENDFGVTEGM